MGCSTSTPRKDTHAEDWDIKSLKNQLFTRFGVDIAAEGIQAETLNRQELGDTIFDKLKERYEAKEQLIGPDAMRHHERIIMLSVIDQQWKDHLLSMDHLREGIGLRGYGQHDPLVEYKRESFDMFEAMMERFEEETVRYLYLMQVIERRDDGASFFTQRRPDRWQYRQWACRRTRRAGSCRRRRSGPETVARDHFHGRHGRSLPAPQATRTGASSHGGCAAKLRRCSKSSAVTKLAATIPVPAAAARNTRSVAGPSRIGGLSLIRT